MRRGGHRHRRDAVQCVPHLARASEELYVFQRTPSSVDVPPTGPTDAMFAEMATPGWPAAWLDSFIANQTMSMDMAAPPRIWYGRLDRCGAPHSGRIMALRGRMDDGRILRARGLDFEKSEIRARIDSIVQDRTRQTKLKAVPAVLQAACFHDEYLDAYNEPAPSRRHRRKGVERVREGVVVQAWSTRRLHHLCIGFESHDFTERAGST